MNSAATISPMHLVPATDPAPVKPLLSAEEKSFLDLLAGILVKDILSASDTLHSKTTTK
jgi:hypothetical protein